MTDELTSMFEEDAATESEQPRPQSTLERITEMAQQLMNAESAVKNATVSLTAAKEAYLLLERNELPELMRELELISIKLEDGTEVEVKDDLACAITVANRPYAHAWLESHQFGGIIKTVLELEFDRGEIELAEEISDKVNEIFERKPDLTETIHAATLKSFVKEQKQKRASDPEAIINVRIDGKLVEKMLKDDPFPDSLFGVFEYAKATITPPKVKKPKK